MNSKKPIVLWISILLIPWFNLSAQVDNDSLWSVWIDDTQADTVRLKAIKTYAWNGYLFTQPDSAHYFAGLQYEFAKEKGLENHMAKALNTQGASLFMRGQLEKAMEAYQESLEIRERIGDRPGVGRSLSNMGNIYWYKGDYNKAIEYYSQCLKIEEELGDSVGMAGSYINIGNIHAKIGNNKKAVDYYSRSLKIEEALKNKSGIAGSLNNIGIILEKQGNYAKAIECYTRSLTIEEELGNKSAIAYSLINIGNIYDNQRNYQQALEYYNKSLKIEEELNNKSGIAGCLFNIGDTYADMGDYDHALEYHERSLDIKEELENKSGIANSLSLIGNIYLSQGAYQKAIEYNNKSLNIAREIGYKSGIVSALQSLGHCYFEQGQYDKAITYSRQSLTIAREIDVANETKKAAFTLYESYKFKSRYKDALEMHELYIDTRDSIESQENQKEVIRQEYKYSYEKQAVADSVKNAEEQKVKDAELSAQKAISKQQKQQSYFLYGGLILALFFGAFIYNRLKLTRKQKGIIEEQKGQVDIAYGELEVKNIQIMDSINYARRIQSAILPPEKLVKSYLKNSFILYKPKDIVAGDFYWMEPMGKNVLFAAADCTGHGVPGAMVSVVCNNGLNRAVREYNLNDPGSILDKTREIVIQEFEKSEEDVQDGMDIAICCLKDQRLSYAGANNPLWIIRNNTDVIEEYKANKQPIGKYDKVQPYTTHHIQLHSGDTFYIFSDGFADQFGGPKGKKFMAAKFKKLLLRIQDKNMEEQYHLLNNHFEEWKGDLEQLDDVCVIGVRV